MRNGYVSPIFSPDLDRPTSRRLSLLFLLQEILTAFEHLQKGELQSFDKLCFYSEILLQASEVEEEELSTITEDMQITLSKLLRSRSQEKIADRLPDFFQKLRALFHALLPFLREERANENVWVVLLEKKEALNHFLGPRTIEEIFRSFFPLGIEELRLFLYEGYSRRGFEDFYAQKEPLIDALEWEPPCDPLLQML